MVWGLTIAVRSQEGTCIGIVSAKVMETETMRRLTLSEFPIIMHGLDLGMDSTKYWNNGKPTELRMPDWNRYKY